jgi:hypothetical protein
MMAIDEEKVEEAVGKVFGELAAAAHARSALAPGGTVMEARP